MHKYQFVVVIITALHLFYIFKFHNSILIIILLQKKHLYSRFINICFSLLLHFSSSSQEFNYVHYNTKDGLAGSTVYDMCQDKDGFIWFATENGLSRFDGTYFKTFTVADGLPDNEVLKLFADSKGRVWIGTFNKDVCYYFKGKIYNKTNDSLLRKVSFTASLASIVEDKEGTIALSDTKTIVLISLDNSRKPLVHLTIPGNFIGVCNVFCDYDKIYAANEKMELYALDKAKDTFYYRFSIPQKFNPVHFNADSFISHFNYNCIGDKKLKLKSGIMNGIVDKGYVTYVFTNDGAWSIDTVLNKWDLHFLPGKKVVWLVEDTEKNLWFATLGEGVYKLPSKETKTINFSGGGNVKNAEIFSLIKYHNNLLGGLGFSKFVLINNNKLQSSTNFQKITITKALNKLLSNRLYCSKTLSSGIAILGFDSYLVKLENDKPTFNYLNPIKSIDEIDSDNIIVGTSSFAFKMRAKDLQIIDTIWRERCTKVFYHNNNYYIGTLNGLYEVKQDKTYKYLGDIAPSLKRRINDIKATPDGTLWVATNDEGIISYKNGKAGVSINESKGLSSNICKTLFLQNNFLWVGTNKGLNKIDLSDKNYTILKFSSSDGLPSDVINAIYVEDSTVYVGSPAGLTYFNENKISTTSLCNLQLLNVSIADAKQKISDSYQLSYKNNNISFEYIGISFKSGGDIAYHYKLKGLDNEWKETRQTNLNYPSLASGDYELQLYAENKFGVKSKTIKINFSISTPFWKTWWFYASLLIIAILITIALVNRRGKKLRQKLEEKNSFQKQFAALEQQALQAQMNPHFIFNCLNSIQQYILTNDKEKANQYLTGFATLIRQTLDNSGKKTITVADEVQYISHYLEMEEMRFGDNFNYSITIDDAIQADYIDMPAMLLQPYIENSLRHGLRYKEDGYGKLDISFLKAGNMLQCIIIDNGIGREKASYFKSLQHIEYQSKGMSLTQKRVDLLNQANENKIVIEVIDIKDEFNQAAGTKVIVNIPI
jgi:hypothetical protein